MAYPPSMVHKSGNKLVVRSVVSGDKLFGTSEETEDETSIGNGEVTIKRTGIGAFPDEALSPECSVVVDQDEVLPQCKVKRNYACSSCSYYTQNPRYYLHHLKNVHKEKIRIYECPHCLYASKHSQKLQRHIHMVHVMGKRKMLIKAKSSPNRKNPAPGGVSKPNAIPEIAATLLGMSPEDDKNEPVHQLPDDEDLTAVPTLQPDDEPELSGDLTTGSSSANTTVVAEIQEEITNETVTAASGADVPLKCSLCPFSSRNPNLVTRHERLVHLKKKFYRCTKCDYITHMKARFTKHVKYHSMPMIKCDMCDFRTPYKWNLDRHNKNHFANGAFKCSQCNFTADIKQSLTVHEMNHHVPPVNQNGAAGMTIPTPAKRRCRVGASDIIAKQQENTTIDPDLDDLELLRMERESLPNADAAIVEENAIEVDTSAVAVDEPANAQMTGVEITMVKPNSASGGKTLNIKNLTAAAYLNGTLKPEDVILTKNGSVYVKKFKCRVCHYKAAWESEMIRHEVRVHGLEAAPKKKPLPRPIPNLIPIQGGSGSGGKSKSTDSSPAKSILDEFTGPLTEKDLNDICAKSCATSSLKDFASLIGADEIKSERLKDLMTMFSSANEDKKDKATPDKRSSESSSDTSPSDPNKKLPDAFKKKNATFFDRLKEKLMVGAGENGNLACWCGHKSKCLSESLMHQKQHSENNEKNEKSVVNGPVISGAELSSTRCQHCRQRCKTSSDLYVHLQSCPEILKKGSAVSQANGTITLHASGSEDVEDDGDLETYADEEEFVENSEPEIKEESKVFVWNNLPEEKEDFAEEYPDEDTRSKSPASEASLVGYEIAPGIGSVIPNNNEDNTTTNSNDRFKDTNSTVDVTNPEIAVKKVFKCPECTFWASTASRFHVHIVSHLNVKPFGCSVCAYQSKWKWDVTKHIRLKKERDASHEHAEMRTIDVETGRRNYTKYNKYLTFMRVHDPDSDTSKSSSKPQSPVPILPKLTPAPSVDGDGASKTTSDVSIRPLPQLHPANPNVSLKRIHEAGDDSEIPKKKTPSEKKMWKCKKCKFRNTDRNVVLSHVKEHYTGGSNAQNANDSNAAAYSREARNQTEGQNVNQSSSQLIASGDSCNQNTSSKEGNYKCKQCVFETDCPTTFIQHNRHHEPNPSAYFKCCFCPFYANDKQFMLNHIALHGVKNVEESLPLITQNVPKDSDDDRLVLENGIEESEFNETMDSTVGSVITVGGDEQMEVFKRFKCTSCPYVTNNKSQYLYHRQFHRLRGSPFKCNVCTYNVTKRHLLHQHLKIHGIKRAQFKNCINDAVDKETTDNTGHSLKLITEIETANLSDIPLVWVYKSGSLTKMFKCRHCPHVNLRKSNIHEHEKMHFDRLQRSPNGSVNPHQSSVHRCTECNYVCNNAGALASHFKVHQGAFGQICALADPRRSDESQCKEITKLIKEDERFSKKASSSNGDPSDDLKRRLSAVAASIDVGSPVRAQETVDATITTFESALPEARTNPPDEKKVLHFCNVCPARFLYLNDLDSHSRFHGSHHPFKCNSCTYSAPQQPHLSAHRRVHSQEYYDKTNQMCMIYETSKDYARPKTTYIVDKPGFPGLGWIVMLTSHKKDDSGKPKVMVKQYSCHKCPAQFFKSVALQHHLTLHGGKDPYQCRSCDYRVKTYGNLIKHEAVHGLEPRMKAKALKSKKQSGNSSIPCSGTELFQHRTEQIAKEQTTPPGPVNTSGSLPVDPEFGILMHGSPEFVYPTTLKNGKMKDKRYKCHKCPSAFEKREQYKVHLLLHGAKYKYKCEKCDYAVKYYANYAQHMRKHDFNEKRLSERRASIVSKASEESGTDTPSESAAISAGLVNGIGSAAENDRHAYAMEKKDQNQGDALICNGKASKTLHISIADQQAVVLMQQKITDNVNLADQLHRCYYCPYSHQRKDAVENHERCHFNNKGSYVCEFCNYTVPQPHFLREHQKLHFGSMKGIKAEAFMKCDRLEIWMETEEGKVLIFKDNGGGGGVKDETRFEPNLSINEEESEYKKMYVDVKTGEEFTPKKQSPNPKELLDSCSDKDKLLPKPFKTLFDESSSSSSMSSYSSPNHVKEEDDDDILDGDYDILPDMMCDDEVKKEPVCNEEMHQDDEVIEDEPDADADAADAEPDQDEIVEPVDDDEMVDIEEACGLIEPDEDDMKEEEESYADEPDHNPDPDDEVGLTSDLEYNDTDMDTETENTNMENSHIDNCADTQEMAYPKEEEEATRTTALVSEEAKGFATETVDDETRLSGEDSDSEDSDSSSSSSCSSSSCSSKSSNDGTSPTSNESTDDEDSKGDVIEESLTNSNKQD